MQVFDKYHKVHSPFKRDMEIKGKPLIDGNWVFPEFESLKHCKWVATEKIDGTNIRIFFDGEKVLFGGRTDNAQIPANLMNHLNDHYTFDFMKQHFPEVTKESPVILFGEGCGHKIQKGGGRYVNNEKRADFILFDVKIGHWWLGRMDVESIADRLEVRHSPVRFVLPLMDLIEEVKSGMKSNYFNDYAEGLVAYPEFGMLHRSGQRIITKIKHRDFYKSSK